MIRIACEHHRHLCPFLQQETSYRNPISAVISTATHNQASGDINLFLFDRFYHLQGRPLHQYQGWDPVFLDASLIHRLHLCGIQQILHSVTLLPPRQRPWRTPLYWKWIPPAGGSPFLLLSFWLCHTGSHRAFQAHPGGPRCPLA